MAVACPGEPPFVDLFAESSLQIHHASCYFRTGDLARAFLLPSQARLAVRIDDDAIANCSVPGHGLE